MTERVILHVDLDAFFAAVEQRDHPELRGKPVIVGGRPTDRGVVSTCSYEARAFGVRSAMPLRTAAALCPQGIFVPVNGRAYQAESRTVMAILRRFTPLVQPVSIDEAFLDVTGSHALFGDGPTIARRIKDAIHEETRLTASVGVARTKLVAKIASDLRKPDGLVVVVPGEEAAFLAPLPISRLWGVGEKTAAALGDVGVRTIGDLAALPRDVLERRFGKHGASLADRARGIDPDPVATGEAAKSIGHEHTFDVDTSDPEVIERTLLGMADGVAGRLRSSGLHAATITLKLRDAAFRTISRQATLPEPTDLADPIYHAALGLLRRELRGQRIRLVGVTASNFRDREQLALFASEDPRRHRAAEALDTIRRKYGARAVTRARLVRAALPAPFERDPMTPLERRDPRRVREVEHGPAGERAPAAADELGDPGIDAPSVDAVDAADAELDAGDAADGELDADPGIDAPEVDQDRDTGADTDAPEDRPTDA